MSRLLLVFALIVLIYMIFRTIKRRTSAPADRVEDMVRCAQCGVHLPKGESLPAAGRSFCCEDHRRSFLASNRKSDG